MHESIADCAGTDDELELSPMPTADCNHSPLDPEEQLMLGVEPKDVDLGLSSYGSHKKA